MAARFFRTDEGWVESRDQEAIRWLQADGSDVMEPVHPEQPAERVATPPLRVKPVQLALAGIRPQDIGVRRRRSAA